MCPYPINWLQDKPDPVEQVLKFYKSPYDRLIPQYLEAPDPYFCSTQDPAEVKGEMLRYRDGDQNTELMDGSGPQFCHQSVSSQFPSEPHSPALSASSPRIPTPIVSEGEIEEEKVAQGQEGQREIQVTLEEQKERREDQWESKSKRDHGK